MAGASRQQWNLVELLHMVGGPMPLHGKWREQRAVRALVKRDVVVVSATGDYGRIESIDFPPNVLRGIAAFEVAKRAGILS
jgi:hypothetical protein